MKATLSILGLYQWDETLFDDLELPEGIDLELVRDNILYNLGNLEVLYPSAPFMKDMIALWSRTELPIWNRLYNAMQLEYNPIENYDRVEEWTDERSESKTGTHSDTESISNNKTNTGTNTQAVVASGTESGTSKDTGTTDNDSTRTRSVNGYNDNTLIVAEQTVDDATETLSTTRTINSTVQNNTNTTDTINTAEELTGSRTNSGNNSDDSTESAEHTGRVHGNIGVTTSQQMLQSELDLAPKLNIINYIVESFKKRFCILVY